jgi:hypothetical protein
MPQETARKIGYLPFLRESSLGDLGALRGLSCLPFLDRRTDRKIS